MGVEGYPFPGGHQFGSFFEMLQWIGDPVDILWTPPVTTTTASGTFTLGDDDNVGTNYDWDGDGTSESQPFKNKMIFITGLEINAPTAGSCSVGKITVDGKVISSSVLAGGEEYYLSGRAKSGEAKAQSIVDQFGGPIAWRHAIIVRPYSGDQIANAQANATIRIFGYVLPRIY